MTDRTLKPPSSAYELITRRDRSAGRAVNLLLIIGTLVTNWVLLFASPIRLWGLYLMLIFVATLVIVDIVRLSALNSNEHSTNLTASFVQNDVRVYILLWIFWLIVTEFFFLSRTWFNFWTGFPLELPMLVATFVVSVQHYGQRTARASFPLLALVALAFPTRDWMPQHEWWPAGVLRVALYFFAVLVAGYALPHRELRLDVMRTEVATALAVHPKNRSPSSSASAVMTPDIDEEDVERTSTSLQFSTTVTHCQNVCLHETERTLTIIALSAWILLVSRVVILFFGLFLVAVQLVIFFVRRNEYEKLRDERVKMSAGGGAVQTATITLTSTSDKTHYTTPTPRDNTDDDATDDGEGSLDAVADKDDAGSASDSMEHTPTAASSVPAAQSLPTVQRLASIDDVRRRSPPASIVANSPMPMMTNALLLPASTQQSRIKTKVLSISKP